MAASPSRGHNAGASSWGWVIPLVVGAVLIVVGGVTAQGGSQDLGEIVWPGEGQRSSQELASLGESLFLNGTEPTVIGEQPITSLQAERINDSATRILIGEQGGESHSFVQPHEPTPADQHTSLEIRPGDLRPTVEVRPNASVRANDVLRVQGPPGSFGLEGDSVEGKIETLADRLDFPLQERRTNVTKISFPGLYGGNRVCLNGAGSDCSVTAALRIDCSSCQMGTFDAPEVSSKLERGFRGTGLFLFDGENRMIAAAVSYHLDLNESALMEPGSARDLAAEEVRDRDHEIRTQPEPDTVSVRGDLASHDVAIRDVRFVWEFVVYTDPPSAKHRESATTYVTQDAVTGEVLSVNVYREKADPAPGLVERVVPGAGSLAALVATSGVAHVLRRRRRSG